MAGGRGHLVAAEKGYLGRPVEPAQLTYDLRGMHIAGGFSGRKEVFHEDKSTKNNDNLKIFC